MMFDDHLALGEQDFANLRAVIFTGPSGAGKSSYLQWLLEFHPAFREQEATLIQTGRPLRWPDLKSIETKLVVVDELLRVADLANLWRLVRRGHMVLAASHLPPVAHRVVTPSAGRVFDLAHGTAKIGNALARLGYDFGPAELQAFQAKHGSSYTALERILTEWPHAERDFGAALRHFENYCTVRTVREPC